MKLGDRDLGVDDPVAVASWTDGRFVVLAGNDAQSLVHFAADGTSTGTVATRNLLGESAPLLVPAPDGGVFVVATDRRRAWWFAPGTSADPVVGRPVRIQTSVHDAVALDGPRLLYVDGSGSNFTVEPGGSPQRVQLGTRTPVERLVRTSRGGLWVLERGGVLHRVGPSLTRLGSTELNGTTIGLAVDEAGAVVLAATWSNADRNQREVHFVGPDGGLRGSRPADHGNQARDLVITDDTVHIGPEMLPRSPG